LGFLLGSKEYTREQAEKEIPLDYGFIWRKRELGRIKAIIALCDMTTDSYLTVNVEDIEFLLEWKGLTKQPPV
jgi:hypothetical protein